MSNLFLPNYKSRFIKLQQEIKAFEKQFKIEKSELYSKLGIETTKNISQDKIESILTILNNTRIAFFKTALAKIFVVRILVKLIIAKITAKINKSNDIAVFKLTFKKVRIRSRNGKISRILYSRRF